MVVRTAGDHIRSDIDFRSEGCRVRNVVVDGTAAGTGGAICVSILVIQRRAVDDDGALERTAAEATDTVRSVLRCRYS